MTSNIETLSPNSLFSLSGKTVLVSGASSGLGEALAFTAAMAGAKVIAAARRIDRLNAMAARHPSIAPVACDVTSEAERSGLVKTALGMGHVDVLINTAGVARGGRSAEDEKSEDIAYTMELNLIAPFKLCQALLPSMKDNGGGAIINVASISGVVGIGHIPQASYSASKSGLVGLTRELALQWARWGIRVNAIAPGFFRSDMSARLWANAEISEWVRSRQPLACDAMPADFAGVMLLLASGAGRFITGQTFAVDGGWTAQ